MPETTIIYTKPGCPYCAAALEHYGKSKIPFKQVDVQGDLARREEMRRLSGALKVPTIHKPDGTVEIGWQGGY